MEKDDIDQYRKEAIVQLYCYSILWHFTVDNHIYNIPFALHVADTIGARRQYATWANY